MNPTWLVYVVGAVSVGALLLVFFRLQPTADAPHEAAARADSPLAEHEDRALNASGFSGIDQRTEGAWAERMPTSLERDALPIASLPFGWLQMTASLPRQGAIPYLDGMSMLLELALRGLVDVPTTTGRGNRDTAGSILVVGAEAADNPTLDGALERLRAFGSPLHAQSAAIRLAPYVASLVVPTVGAEDGRTRARDAIVGGGATDIRTALLLWMLKQDLVFGAFTIAALFPKPTGVTRRALRRVGPDFYALADHEVAATAHRVLFALFRMPAIVTG